MMTPGSRSIFHHTGGALQRTSRSKTWPRGLASTAQRRPAVRQRHHYLAQSRHERRRPEARGPRALKMELHTEHTQARGAAEPHDPASTSRRRPATSGSSQARVAARGAAGGEGEERGQRRCGGGARGQRARPLKNCRTPTIKWFRAKLFFQEFSIFFRRTFPQKS